MLDILEKCSSKKDGESLCGTGEALKLGFFCFFILGKEFCTAILDIMSN